MEGGDRFPLTAFLRLLVFDSLDFDVVADELVDVRDHRGRLDVHQDEGRYDVAAKRTSKNVRNGVSRKMLRHRGVAAEVCVGAVPLQCIVSPCG